MIGALYSSQKKTLIKGFVKHSPWPRFMTDGWTLTTNDFILQSSGGELLYVGLVLGEEETLLQCRRNPTAGTAFGCTVKKPVF